jgi:hypothetical protein
MPMLKSGNLSLSGKIEPSEYEAKQCDGPNGIWTAKKLFDLRAGHLQTALTEADCSFGLSME